MSFFKYDFPTIKSPHFKYDNDVSINDFDPNRIVTTGVAAKKVDNPSAPTPFYEIPIKYDYSSDNDGSVVGPLVITTDDNEPIVIDWGVNSPPEDLIQKSIENRQKPPNHSVKLELTGSPGEKLKGVFVAVKNAVVKLLVNNQKSIGSHGSKAMMSGDPSNYFNAILKPHDLSQKKLPSGEYETVPTKYLNLVEFNNTSKITGKQEHVIKTHFFAPSGEGDGQTDIHVRDLIKKKITVHPEIYFSRVYCGATLSIQSFLDSAMVVDVENPSARSIAPSAKRRIASYNSTNAEKFRTLCEQITVTSTSGSVVGDHHELITNDDHVNDLLDMGEPTGLEPTQKEDDFDASLAAVTKSSGNSPVPEEPPKRTFRRVVPPKSD